MKAKVENTKQPFPATPDVRTVSNVNHKGGYFKTLYEENGKQQMVYPEFLKAQVDGTTVNIMR